MAAPHVSGAAALLYGLGPNLFAGWGSMTQVQRMSAVRQRLLERSQRWASLAGMSTTGGHANLFNLVEEDSTPPARATASPWVALSRRRPTASASRRWTTPPTRAASPTW